MLAHDKDKYYHPVKRHDSILPAEDSVVQFPVQKIL